VLFELTFQFGESGADARLRVGRNSSGMERARRQRQVQRKTEIGLSWFFFEAAVQLHQIRGELLEKLFQFLKMAPRNLFDRRSQIRTNVTEGNFHCDTLFGLSGIGLEPEEA